MLWPHMEILAEMVEAQGAPSTWEAAPPPGYGAPRYPYEYMRARYFDVYPQRGQPSWFEKRTGLSDKNLIQIMLFTLSLYWTYKTPGLIWEWAKENWWRVVFPSAALLDYGMGEQTGPGWDDFDLSEFMLP